MNKGKWLGLMVLSLAVLVAVGAFLGVRLTSPAEGTEQIGIDKAKESVYGFEGGRVPDLEKISGPELPGVNLIRLSNGSTIYGVNSQTGNVELAIYGNTAQIGQILITKEEAEAVAGEFAREHCAFFAILTLTESKLIGHDLINEVPSDIDLLGITEYHFRWTQVTAGALTPNFVKISVSPETGQVMCYICRYQPIEPAGSPSLSKEEAVAIVKEEVLEQARGYGQRAGNYGRITEVVLKGVSILEGPELTIIIEDGKQYLTWMVEAKPEGNIPPFIGGGRYYIEACTGDIVRVDRYA